MPLPPLLRYSAPRCFQNLSANPPDSRIDGEEGTPCGQTAPWTTEGWERRVVVVIVLAVLVVMVVVVVAVVVLVMNFKVVLWMEMFVQMNKTTVGTGQRQS